MEEKKEKGNSRERKKGKGTGKVPREERKANKKVEEVRKTGTESGGGEKGMELQESSREGGREGKDEEGRCRTIRKVSLTICPVVLVTTASTGSMERGRFTASTANSL